MEQLLYISESRLDAATTEANVRNVVAWSETHNPPLRLSGALLFTGRYFVQILEGPTQPLDNLMAAIGKDTRHDNVVIKSRTSITMRSFPDWALAYHGPSQFVARYVMNLQQAQTPSELRRASSQFVDLAQQFTSASAL